jgi:hypothetical protein
MMTALMKGYQHILAMVEESITRLSTPDGPSILTFWAGPGGGKTTFLNMVRNKYAGDTLLVSGPWDFRSSPPEALASQVLTSVQEAPAGASKLVLLDNLDELLHTGDGEPFFAFERQVLCELVRRGDTLIVVTSRAPLVQWRDYEVRISARNLHIHPLSREDVAEWARERQLDPDQAFEISLGHPQVLAWLQEQPNIPPEEIDRRVADLFLNGLSEKTRQLAEVASLFPVFDLAALRPVLSAEDTESFYSEYVERLEELIRKGLVFWDGEVGAYRFQESTVRRLLARGVLHRDPEQFQHIHQVAAGYYQQEAQRATYLHRSLVSALYHTAQAHFGKGEEAGKVCIHWIENTLGMWLGAPWEKVLWAWETGAGDEATREELQALLGPAAFERITRLLESAAQAAAPIIQQVQEVNR